MIDTRLSFALWLLFDLMFLSAIVARADVRQELIAEDRVDVCEVNFHFTDDCKLAFTQVIWWQHSNADNRLRVLDFRIVKSPELWPICGQCIWTDGEILRRVKARRTEFTGGFIDPEVEDRKDFDTHGRAGLWNRGMGLR